MALVDDVAAAVLARTGPVTAMQLQKFVYYVQAWHLAEYDELAFGEPIEAWKDGPVVRRLFERHRGQRSVRSWLAGNPAALPRTVMRIVDRVVRTYGQLTGDQLSDIAHRELPWRQARGRTPATWRSNEEIDPETMREFYRRQAGGSAEHMVRYAVASARLEGASDPSPEELETLLAVAEGRVEVEEAIAEVLAPYR